jgi:hypothetical protein
MVGGEVYVEGYSRGDSESSSRFYDDIAKYSGISGKNAGLAGWYSPVSGGGGSTGD